MTRQDALLDFIERELADNGAAIDLDDELLTTGKIDSLGLMRLVSFIGEEFSVTVPYEDILIENFKSVRAIDAYLQQRHPSGD